MSRPTIYFFSAFLLLSGMIMSVSDYKVIRAKTNYNNYCYVIDSGMGAGRSP